MMLKVFENPDDEVLVSSILRTVRDLAVADDTILSAVEIFLVPFIRYSNKCIGDDIVVQVWRGGGEGGEGEGGRRGRETLLNIYPFRMVIHLLFILFSTSAFWINVAKILLPGLELLVCPFFSLSSSIFFFFSHYFFSSVF